MEEYINSPGFINDFKEGNRTAFNAVFEMYFPRIFAFCQKLVRRSDEAEDIASHSFTQLFRYCAQLHSEANIRGFLYVVSRNACMKYLAKKKRTEAVEFEVHKILCENDYIRLNDELDGMYIQIFMDAIKKLPPRQNQLMEKLYIEKLDYQAASDKMGVKVNALHVLHRKAVISIKKILRSDGLPESVILLMALERCIVQS